MVFSMDLIVGIVSTSQGTKKKDRDRERKIAKSVHKWTETLVRKREILEIE